MNTFNGIIFVIAADLFGGKAPVGALIGLLGRIR